MVGYLEFWWWGTKESETSEKAIADNQEEHDKGLVC